MCPPRNKPAALPEQSLAIIPIDPYERNNNHKRKASSFERSFFADEFQTCAFAVDGSSVDVKRAAFIRATLCHEASHSLNVILA